LGFALLCDNRPPLIGCPMYHTFYPFFDRNFHF
jgi:hypothetical protein